MPDDILWQGVSESANPGCSDDQLREVAVSAPSMVSPTYKMNSVFRSMATFLDFERVWDGVHSYFRYDSHLLLTSL